MLENEAEIPLDEIIYESSSVSSVSDRNEGSKQDKNEFDE